MLRLGVDPPADVHAVDDVEEVDLKEVGTGPDVRRSDQPDVDALDVLRIGGQQVVGGVGVEDAPGHRPQQDVIGPRPDEADSHVAGELNEVDARRPR